MLSAEQNDRITRVGPGTPAGTLLRRYWQPAALVDELVSSRPIKPVRLLGEDLVIYRDEKGRYGLLGRACPHRRRQQAMSHNPAEGLSSGRAKRNPIRLYGARKAAGIFALRLLYRTKHSHLRI